MHFFEADDWMATRCLSDAFALIIMSVSVYMSCVCAVEEGREREIDREV